MTQFKPLTSAPTQGVEKKIKIMLVDDHTSARQAYCSVIGDEEDFEVMAQAANGLELLNYLGSVNSLPDIVILDIEMPVMSGLEALPKILHCFPEIKVIILSMNDERTYITELLLRGAAAYLPKNCSIEELVETIRRVAQDGYYFDGTTSHTIASQFILDGQEKAGTVPTLTEREREILRQVCMDKNYKEIASALGISVHTVKFHLKNLYTKTNSKGLVPLVKYAIRNGIADLD